MKGVLGNPMYYAKYYGTQELQILLREHTIRLHENKEELKNNKLYFIFHVDDRNYLKEKIAIDEDVTYGIARAIEIQLDYFDTTGKQLWAD